MNTPSYIELVGVAGSGKSVAAVMLDQDLNGRGVRATRRLPLGHRPLFKYVLALRSIMRVIRTPRLIRYFFATPRAAYAGTPHIIDTIRNLAVRLVIDTGVIRSMVKNRGLIVINDEGLIGKCVSLSVLATISYDDIVRTVGLLLPRPTTIVFVKTEPDRAMTREAERQEVLPFFKEMESGTKERFFNETTACYERLCRDLSENEGIQSVVVSNDRSVDELRRAIHTCASTIS